MNRERALFPHGLQRRTPQRPIACLVFHVSALVEEGVNPIETGDKVRFQVSDVFLPNQDPVPCGLPVESELEGTIINFSDSGRKARVFALIEIAERQTVVVPVEKLQAVPRPELEHPS